MAYGDIAEPPVRRRRRPARAVRRGRDGRGVHLRRPRAADLARQRRGDDRRLLPHPPGHARRRDRHHRLPRAELRHHLHHQAAAPRHRHRPRRPLARPGGPEDHRRHAPVPARAPGPPGAPRPPRPARAAPGGGRTGPRFPAWLPSGTTYRRCSPPNRSARPCASWRSTAGTDCPWYRRTSASSKGWVTSEGVLRALARRVAGTADETAHAQAAADGEPDDPQAMLEHPSVPLPGYYIAEITITGNSPAAGRKLGDVSWPQASIPVLVLRGGSLQPAAPGHHPGPRRPGQPAHPRGPGHRAVGRGTPGRGAARVRTRTTRAAALGRNELPSPGPFAAPAGPR